MSDIALIDAETIAALKVLRGDDKKDANSIDKEFGSSLAQQVVDALSLQKDVASTQNAELVAAVREQTAALLKLTDIIQAQKTTVVVVNKDQHTAKEGSSVASTAVETDMMSLITEDANSPTSAAVFAAIKESPVVVPPIIIEPDPTEAITRGPWGFVESKDAIERRSLVVMKDSLFGKVSGNDLEGDCFGAKWGKMRNRVDQYGKLKAPKWATKGKGSVRSYIPMLSIDGKTKIDLRTGIYYLTVKYEATKSSEPVEAGIIIGELSFDNNGSVLAPGAKLKQLLTGEKQKEPRVANNKQKWYSSVVSEPWQNGDIVRFKIDTNTNSITYTLSSGASKKIKAGWRFENVLSFTSVPTYRKDIRVFAYCGMCSSSTLPSAKLTIVDDPILVAMMSKSKDGESPEQESEQSVEPELEAVVESAETETEVEESAQPTVEPIAEPASEPTAQPAAESASEPAADSAAEKKE